jgi:hypothetical protein
MYLGVPISPIGEKRMAFRSLDWSVFQQIRQLLAERTHAFYASLGVPEFINNPDPCSVQ